MFVFFISNFLVALLLTQLVAYTCVIVVFNSNRSDVIKIMFTFRLNSTRLILSEFNESYGFYSPFYKRRNYVITRRILRGCIQRRRYLMSIHSVIGGQVLFKENMTEVEYLLLIDKSVDENGRNTNTVGHVHGTFCVMTNELNCCSSFLIFPT